MLNRIEIHKKDGGVLTLPIYDATNYQIKDVQGLDPVKANIVTSNFAHIDGTQFQSSRREMRNIVMKLSIDSFGVGKSVQELRKDLYSFLMPKTDVTLKFIRDNLESMAISGQIESFDSSLFVKEPEATISILCFDPDFKNETPDIFAGTTVTTTTNSQIIYNGEVDSGFIFTMTPTVNVDTFTLQNTLSDGSVRKLIFDSATNPILAGQTVIISTISGDKYVRVSNNGTISSILWGLDPSSDWVSLQSGTNNIRVNTATSGMPYTIEYYTRFGGL